MKTCITCGHSINRGGHARENNERCVICLNDEAMRGWRYPASTKSQRKLREARQASPDGTPRAKRR